VDILLGVFMRGGGGGKYFINMHWIRRFI